jgi:hypothetical protein
MPNAKYKTVINASYDRVLGLLLDKAERPRKYVPVVLHSDILERGEGYIIREMFQPKPVPLTIKEKIYERDVPGGKEFIYEHLNNKDYTGNFHNVLTRIPGRDDQAGLEYIMDWRPREGTTDKLSNEVAQTMVERGVNFLKNIAENPVVVPDLVRKFFEAVDSMRPDAMAPLLANDCKFRVANHTEMVGVDTVVNMNREVMKMFAGITHHYVDVVTVGNRVYAETFVEYVMPDRKTYLLPFMTSFEHRDNKITSVKIFGDMSPLKHGW